MASVMNHADNLAAAKAPLDEYCSVVPLKAELRTTHDRYGFLNRRFVYVNLLEEKR
ncbi:hypothetical protein GKR41_00227 [Candidatus Vallotia lariciata]|nr:hypothetical protein GKR41_00227 [Candidatus Vallotia lariciata]